jgi:hypothetical protein
MASSIIAGSLALATVEDLQRAELYHGIASWITRYGSGDVDKFVFERVDGGFDTFTLPQLRESTWWRLGNPDDVLFVEALLEPGRFRTLSADSDASERHFRMLEGHKQAISSDQAATRLRLEIAK